jgi:hypothetical protein
MKTGTLIYDFTYNCYAIRYVGRDGELISINLFNGQKFEIFINKKWQPDQLKLGEEGYYFRNHPDENGFGCPIRVMYLKKHKEKAAPYANR